MSTHGKQLKEARARLEALTADVPKLEQVHAERRQALRDARLAGADMAELERLQAAESTVAAMLETHRSDIEEARQTCAELDTAGQDEEALAMIAEHTLKFRQAEAAWYQMMDEAEAAIRRAVTLSDYLARKASTARSEASGAAGAIVTRNGGDARDREAMAEQLRRGVAGADVEALTPATSAPQRWVTHPHGGRFEALAKLPTNRAGMWAKIEDPAAETGIE